MKKSATTRLKPRHGVLGRYLGIVFRLDFLCIGWIGRVELNLDYTLPVVGASLLLDDLYFIGIAFFFLWFDFLVGERRVFRVFRRGRVVGVLFVDAFVLRGNVRFVGLGGVLGVEIGQYRAERRFYESPDDGRDDAEGSKKTERESDRPGDGVFGRSLIVSLENLNCEFIEKDGRADESDENLNERHGELRTARVKQTRNALATQGCERRNLRYCAFCAASSLFAFASAAARDIFIAARI